MKPETIDTINAVLAIGFCMWSLLGLVLWYFKRDSFLWLFPSSGFVWKVPSLAVFCTFVYAIDALPGPKVGPVMNGIMLGGVLVLSVLPAIGNKLLSFRDRIEGNKIK